MITRDPVTRNIIITPDDIPAIAGLIASTRERLQADVDCDKCPEWMARPFLDAAELFEKARDQA